VTAFGDVGEGAADDQLAGQAGVGTVMAAVSASRPSVINFAAMAPSFATPIMITSVVLARASADQSRVDAGSSGAA
jgi:hypothetical protein